MIQQLDLENKNNNEEEAEKEKINKQIRTTATIKEKNYLALNNESQNLNIPKYQVAILCMELFIKNRHHLIEKKLGTVQYNEPAEYSTLGLIYENEDKFELFLSLRMINRYSVSFLMDKAIEMYLSIVIKMIVTKIKTIRNVYIQDNLLEILILSINPVISQFKINHKKSHFISFSYDFLIT